MQRSEFAGRFLEAIALVRAGRIGKVKKVTCGIGVAGRIISPARAEGLR